MVIDRKRRRLKPSLTSNKLRRSSDAKKSETNDRRKEKKQAEIDKMLEGSKVAGSDEIYLVANDHQEAKEIYGLNDDHTRSTVIASRQAQLDASSGKNVNFKDLADVKQQRMMNAVRSGTQSVKGKGR